MENLPQKPENKPSMKNLFLLLGCFLFPSPAKARWVDPSEVASKVNFETVRYKIKKGGAYTVDLERQLEIVKDNARADMGISRFQLDFRDTEFELLEAKTINGKEEIPVRKEHIEEKSLASSGQGFDDKRQVTIAFPQVNVGSRLYYKYRRKSLGSGISDLFSVYYPLGWNELVEREELVFESELPLYYEVRDPENKLEVKEEEKDGSYLLRMRLKAPFFRQIVQEDKTVMDPLSLIWISVSSAKDWGSFPQGTPKVYQSVIRSELPEEFLPILEKAKAASSELDRINAVTSGLQEMIRYVGDWQGIEGAMHPRPLATVAATGFGDCKDFTSVTAAILNRLGFEAHAAWVGRGVSFLVAPLEKVASPDINHAIVYARKGGKEYWIDPTNSTSFAQAIYPDIAGRPAIVFLPGEVKYTYTPAMRPEEAKTELKVKLKFGKNEEVDAEGDFRLHGRSALPITGRGLAFSKSQIEYQLINWFVDSSDLRHWKFQDFDLTSRVVKDFYTSFSFREKWVPLTTSLGDGYSLPWNPFFGMFKVRLEERAGDLKLDEPNEWSRTYRLSGRKTELRQASECSGKSKWVDFRRKITLEGGALVVKEDVKLKVAKVPASEVRSKAFAKTQGSLLKCLQRTVAVF
jgi:transglutaminase-like putative cysteine protease